MLAVPLAPLGAPVFFGRERRLSDNLFGGPVVAPARITTPLTDHQTGADFRHRDN